VSFVSTVAAAELPVGTVKVNAVFGGAPGGTAADTGTGTAADTGTGTGTGPAAAAGATAGSADTVGGTR
jgi:hypothetical protein